MDLFIDSADIDEIALLAKTGLVDGVTTNPSLVAKTKGGFSELIKEICHLVKGPVSAEVSATQANDIIKQGITLGNIADNVCIKVPLTWEGLKATKQLRQAGLMVNVTLCFSATQALLAAKAGASFISPFIGRLDDRGENGLDLIKDIKQIYTHYKLNTKILAASIRSQTHITQSALLGADCATLPPLIFRELIKHELTDKGLARFLDDWNKTDKTI